MKKFLPHLAAILLFMLLPVIYFSPALEGKKLNQHDTNTYIGMSKEINDYNATHDDVALWTNSMFGGMPAYLIGVPSFSLVTPIYKLTNLFDWRPVSFVFLYLIGFYIALLLFNINPWLAIVGALAFGFSSYNFIIIAAGHNSKAIAIGYMAPLIAGLYHALKKDLWKGSIIFALFLALQVYANHLQITYYTLLTILVMGLTELWFAFREKRLPEFLKRSAIIFAFALLAVAANTERLWTTYEYGNFSIRGKSDLTHNQQNQTSGLDKDYATGWSYGIDESFTLLVPNFKGGSSTVGFGQDSETAKALKANNVPNANQLVKQLPGYWGDQPGTSGPVYAGAVIVFLFVLGLFLVKGPFRIWIAVATLLSLMLSWGHNFMALTDFFLDYVPGYNKFRTVSMILVIASFTLPLMAIYVLEQIFSGKAETQNWKKALGYSVLITAGLSLVFAIIPGISGSFTSVSDSRLPEWLHQSLAGDREQLLRSDAFRSAIFILLSAAALWAFLSKKIKLSTVLPALGLLILLDLWMVDRRYLNNDNFVPAREAAVPYAPSVANQEILTDKAPGYRVLNMTVDPFSDASTSYYHHSVGGYHGAKMRRYQELIDFHISKEMQLIAQRFNSLKSLDNIDTVFTGLNALNMLNTRYLIVNPSAAPVQNNHALGSAWLVHEYRTVENADQEIAALGTINPVNEIVVNKIFETQLNGKTFVADSTAFIALKSYAPNQLVYHFSGKSEQIAVFSEIYYPKGWNAYVNNQQIAHFQANYLLRAALLAPGDYDIEFRFEPQSFYTGRKIAMVSSVILVLLLAGILFGGSILNKKPII